MEEVIRFIPKNIKQVGERDQENKVYIEDYVVTFLKQLSKEEGNMPKEVILLGKNKEVKNISYYYIYGSIAIDGKEGTKLQEKIDKYFPESKILGSLLINAREKDDQISYEEGKLYIRVNFDENYQNIILIQNGLHKAIGGYQIFYSSNEEMQIYMIEWHENRNDKPIEEVGDSAIRQFRAKGNADELVRIEKQKSNTLQMACSTIAIVLCVIGISMLNNYDQLKTMENKVVHLSDELNKDDITTKMIEEQEEAKLVENNGQDIQEVFANQAIIKEETKSSPIIEEDNTIENEQEETKEEEIVGTQEVNLDPIIEDAVLIEEKTTSKENNDTNKKNNAEEKNKDNIETINGMDSQSYVIEKGDTLAAISTKFYKDTSKVKEICNLNQIKNPNNISINQEIILP